MFALPQNTILLANLLLPNSIPEKVEWLFLCSLTPILTAALFGARVTTTQFGWKHILGATLGVAMGVVLSPLAFGVSNLLVNLTAHYTDGVLPLADTGFAITNILFFLMSSSVVYFVSKIGRPAHAAHGTVMETLNQNLQEIDELGAKESEQRSLENGNPYRPPAT